MHHFERGYRFGETDGPTRSDRRKRPGDSDFAGPGAVGEISRARDPGAGDSLAPVIGKSLEDLSTPAVLVDLDVLERNIGRMAARAREAGVRLRPHAKTHKCPHIARLQRAAGAWGLSVAKVGEAEVFADAGFDDLFVAFPVVGEDKGRRLLALADRVRIAVGVDSVEGASTLARPFRAAGQSLDVLLKVDVGYGRVGVTPERAVEVGRAVSGLAGLRLRGVFTHAGHGYLADTKASVDEIARLEGLRLAEAASELRAAGLAIEEVSVGSTPTAAEAMRGRRGDRVPPRELRLPRRLPGRARHLPPRGLRPHDRGHGRERARPRPGGRGCREQDPVERPSAAPPRAATARCSAARAGSRSSPRSTG